MHKMVIHVNETEKKPNQLTIRGIAVVRKFRQAEEASPEVLVILNVVNLVDFHLQAKYIGSVKPRRVLQVDLISVSVSFKR